MKTYTMRTKDVGAIRRALAAHKHGVWKRLVKEFGERVVIKGERDGDFSINNLVVPVYDVPDDMDTDLYSNYALRDLRGWTVELLDDDPRIVLDIYLSYPRNHFEEGMLIGNAEVIYNTETGEATIGRVIADFG